MVRGLDAVPPMGGLSTPNECGASGGSGASLFAAVCGMNLACPSLQKARQSWRLKRAGCTWTAAMWINGDRRSLVARVCVQAGQDSTSIRAGSGDTFLCLGKRRAVQHTLLIKIMETAQGQEERGEEREQKDGDEAMHDAGDSGFCS